MGEFKNFTKPPLGATPAWLSAETRIDELSAAIQRVVKEGQTRFYHGTISVWAEQIIAQCKIIEEFDKYEGD